MSQVLSFKLLGGEEVVAEVLETKSGNQLLTEGAAFANAITSYVVKRPHILQFQQMGNGQVGLAFVPWTLSNPTIERIEIPASSVLLTFLPSERVERQYLEQTSGISLAAPGQRISS